MISAPLVTGDRSADVIVVGGGLHGCSAALQLARRGLSVILLEKDYVGRHASGVNAGGVRRLGRDLAEVPLSVASAEMWAEIEDLVHDDCGFHASAQIKVAESPELLEQLKARAESVRALGYEHEQIIGRNALRDRLPAVGEHCVGALIVEGDGAASPYRTTVAFARRARALGARILEGTRVDDIRRASGGWQVDAGGERYTGGTLLNCAGAWAGRLAAMLGDKVPVEAQAPMLMITARMPHFVDAVVGTQGRTLSFKQFENGTVMIGGGYRGKADLATNRTTLDQSGLSENAVTAMDVFPIMRRARVVRQWAGIEAVMPDNIPVIGRASADGAFHAFGFSAHGFQLGPIVGKQIAELIFNGKPSISLDAFSARRFA